MTDTNSVGDISDDRISLEPQPFGKVITSHSPKTTMKMKSTSKSVRLHNLPKVTSFVYLSTDFLHSISRVSRQTKQLDYHLVIY